VGELLRIPFSDRFIESLGEYLIERCDNKDFSSCAIVFPGIRPSHFLLDYLKKRIKGPFLPPARFSIDEWMQYLFSLKRDERIPDGDPDKDFDLIYLLYRAIVESGIDKKSSLFKLASSINNYIHWGGRILNAMEEFEIQKAKRIEIEALAEYDENFLDWVRDFWKHFVLIRDKFYYLLRINNLTYRGEVYDWTSENIGDISDSIQFDKVIFAGFYALNKSENKMMKHLYSRNKTDIIIQSDEIEGEIPRTSPYYSHKKWEGDWGITFKKLNNRQSKKPELKIHQCFDSHTEILTAEEILSGFKEKDINTAIVLPDPAPLIPLISEVVQASKDDFNITMGYPLKRTSLFTLLKYVFSLQKTKKKTEEKNLYYLKDYLNLIQHPWIKTIRDEKEEESFRMAVNRLEPILVNQNREEAKNFFSLGEIKKLLSVNALEDEVPVKDALESLEKVHTLSIKVFDEIKSLKEASEKLHSLISFLYTQSSVKKYPLNNQFVGKLFEKLEEIKNSLFADINFPDSYDIITFLESYLGTLRVPFFGEPLKGVQIMGMLESRNLNFEQAVLLDVNEGTMPDVNKFDPLLPQGLRKLIDLPTYEEKESMYAYNFFRLINGAKEVHLIFKEGKLKNVDKNIKSRFIEKIIWEKEKKNEKRYMDNRLFAPSVEVLEKKEIEKSKKALKKLKEMEYSPTRIDTYIRCPLQFYYRYVLGLEEFMGIEEEVEHSTIGKFTHDFLKDYYTKFLNKKFIPDKSDYEKKLKVELEKNFREGGGQLILKDIISTTLNRFMDYEIERAEEQDIYIKNLEEVVSGDFITKKGKAFKFQGRIDRVEETGGILKVIDYKTGTVIIPGKIKEREFDFSRETIYNKIKSFQLPIYVYLYSKHSGIPVDKIQAGIFNIRKPREKNTLACENMEIFLDALAFILEEITNPDIPFFPDPDHYCEYCPYRLMCSEG